ncbi:hypothetical protein [Streptomyces viridosporus]|uniref:hypothetical protein n=1 Tax=Streptomyces viridosporus TaxID=67581 RepID=UPI003700B831
MGLVAPGAAQGGELLPPFGQQVPRALQVAVEEVHAVAERLETDAGPEATELDDGFAMLFVGSLAAVGVPRFADHRDAVLRQDVGVDPHGDRPDLERVVELECLKGVFVVIAEADQRRIGRRPGGSESTLVTAPP